MKIKPLAEAKAQLTATIEGSQTETVIITRHGRPVALLVGIEGEALQDVLRMSLAQLPEIIRRRRLLLIQRAAERAAEE